jgi:putative transposase
MSLGERRARIEAGHPKLSLSRQCRLLRVSRSSLYHKPKGESEGNRALMRRLDELFMAHPFYGSRQMVRHLRREGVRVGRHRVRRLMRLMGLEAIYQAPRTSRRHPAHRVYPYLLKGVAIERPGHVWSADITYIPVQKGFLYLVAVMDWATRRVLSWRLSNTLDTRFCTDALTEALERYGCPEIFNTDQGSQFTSQEFTSVLNESGVAISMDGRGRCMDNIFIERLWRSLKYEAVYLHELSDGFRAQKVISRWVAFYNSRRPHSALGGATPAEAYDRGLPAESRKKTSPSLPAPLQHQDEVNKNLAA